MTQATIRLSDLPPAEQQTIRASLAVGTKLTLNNIDFDSPIGPMWQGYIEGWTHQFADNRHVLTMQVVDRLMIEPAIRWQDIPSALMWQEISPSLAWDDTAKGFS